MSSKNTGNREQAVTDHDFLLRKAKYLVFEITCGEIRELLAAAGISLLVLKGPHVASTIYDNPDEREYCDLDLLVRPEHFFSAATILMQNGFHIFSVNRQRLASEKDDYQMLLRAPRGVTIEMHRALADGDQYRSDVQGFFMRSEEFIFGALRVRGLGKEDLLLHLCLHFGKRHFMTSEKKHLLDIALLLQKEKVDWPDFLTKVRRTGCCAVTFYCLAAVQRQHGAVIPPEVLASVRPGPGRRRLLDKFLDPAAFPIYRFQNHIPGLCERMVNLMLIDRFSTMIFSLFRFGQRSVMNRLLTVGLIRREWLKGHPLREWME